MITVLDDFLYCDIDLSLGSYILADKDHASTIISFVWVGEKHCINQEWLVVCTKLETIRTECQSFSTKSCMAWYWNENLFDDLKISNIVTTSRILFQRFTWYFEREKKQYPNHW